MFAISSRFQGRHQMAGNRAIKRRLDLIISSTLSIDPSILIREYISNVDRDKVENKSNKSSS